VTSFSALTNNVTITTSLSGVVSGLGGLNTNVLNQSGDFTSGVANMTAQQMRYTGVGGLATFTATGGGKTGISNAILIKAAPATRLVLRTAGGDSTANLAAGTAQNLKITAKDANGNIDSTYAGPKSLIFSGADPSPSPVTPPKVSNSSGTDIAFGTATSILFSNGEAIASGTSNGVMHLYLTQNKIVSVTDGSLSTSGTERLTVNVSAGVLGKFAWALVTPQTSGVAFTGLDTLTAQDDYGNTFTSMDASGTPVTITSSLGGTITGLGSGGNNILNRSSDFSSGIAALNGKLVFTGSSGTSSFTAAAAGGKNGTSPGIVITAGTAVRLVVRTSVGDSVISLAAGVAQGLKITARDASGNIATGYAGAKTLNFFGASVSPAPDSKNPTVSDNAGTLRNFSASQNTSITFTNGVATVSGANNGIMRLYKVETASIGAGDGTITTASADQLTATVTPGGLGRFNVVITSPQVNGSTFTGVNTVTAIDSFGNVATTFSAAANNVTVTPSGLTGSVSGLGSGNNNVLNQSGDFVLGIANVTGKMKYTGTVGSGTFSATSATGKIGTSGSVTINVGAATRLVITGNANQLAGSGQNLTITAKDSSGNVVTSYAGDKNLQFSGSSPSTNPVTYPTVSDKDGFVQQFGAHFFITFTSGQATVSGTSNGVLRLYRAGKDTIAVNDGTISSGGSDRLIVSITEDVLQKFVFTLQSPQQSGVAFTGTNTLIAQDSYGNVVTTFNAASDNVVVSANSPLSGTVTGLGSGSNNTLNQASDFSGGVASLTGKIVFTGATGSGLFTAASATSKVGSSGTVQIVAGGATRLVLNGVASMSAGGSQSLTITAKDASGNTVTTYTGTKNLTFSGADTSGSGSVPTVSSASGTAVPFGAVTAITFTNGIATVSGSNNGVMRLYLVETAIISASDQTISSSGTDRLTVAVTPSTLGRFAWSVISPQTSGVAFSGVNTLTAQDDWGNTLGTFDPSASPVTITTSMSGAVAGLGSGNNNVINRSTDFVAGVANLTALGMTYTGSIGSGTFTATGGGKSGVSATVQIVAGNATRLVIRNALGDSVLTLTAGGIINLRITAKDVSGNTVTTYGGAHTLTFSGADSSLSPAASPSVTNTSGTATPFGVGTSISFVNGVANISGNTNGVMKLYRAQPALIAVTDGSRSSTGSDRLTVTVNPSSLGKFAWVLATPQVNGAAFTGVNTLTAQDDWGNALTGFDASASNVTVATTLSGSVGGLGTGNNSIMNKAGDFTAGVANLTSMGMTYTGEIGSGTFTATSGGKAGTSQSIDIIPGGASKLVITGSVSQTAGTPQNLTITARDASNNLVPTYTGGKSLTFSGANASTNPVTQPSVTDSTGVSVPFGTATSIRFTNGVATVSAGSNGALKLYKAEQATIAVTDGTVSASGADRLTVTVTPATLGKFAWALTTPQVNGVALTGTNTLAAQDDWGNVVPTFNASTNNVTVTTGLTASPSAITGLGTLSNNVLNQAGDFVLGVANLTGLGMRYTAAAGKGTFIATSAVGSKSGTSDSVTINNPVPSVTGILPIAGSRLQLLPVTVSGTNFLPGVTQLSLGVDCTVDSVVVQSPTQLTARVRPSATATLGLRSISVSNPVPGGGSATLANAFRVENIPSITSLTPSIGVRGQTLDVTILGTNFADGVSDVGTSGTGITLNTKTVTSPTTIVVNISISLSATDGVRPFHVTNSGTEGGQSNTTGFTVGSNPLPKITSISPATAKRQQSLQDTVKGANFFNGITLLNMGPGIVITGITIDSASQLRANITVTDTAATGARNVIVTNGAPGGGPDTLKGGFTIQNPVPTLTGLSLQNAARLQTVSFTLAGTNFISGVTQVFLGNNISFGSVVAETPTLLRVGMTVDSAAVLGPRDVTVSNPAPGGGSATIVSALTINNPIPSITTIAPESTAVNGPSLQLAVTGTNFVPGCVVRLGGRTLVSTLVNRTRMTATVLASDIDTARSFVVDVFAALPGGGASNSKNFVVQNPIPALTSVAPASGSRLQTLDVMFTGKNYLAGVTTVDWGGSDITTNSYTVTDSAHLRANITISGTATMGARDVFVKNPAPGGGNSQKLTFTVSTNPAPTITALSPDGWSRLRTTDIVITGTNFISGVTSVDFGTGIVVNGPAVVNSASTLTANITITLQAPTGLRSVSVTNAPPGGGTTTKTNAFTVFNPAPHVTYVDPPNGKQLETQNVQIQGDGFIDGVSSVNFGSGITIDQPKVVNDTVITASITITVNAATGPRDVQVSNGAPGGGVGTLTNGFVVGNNPAPTVKSVTPSAAKRLDRLDLIFRGTNFISGVTSIDLGQDTYVNTLTVDSSSGLTANVTFFASAATGARTIYLKNAEPGGGRDSIVNGFTITNPVPTLTSITPPSAFRPDTLPVILRGTKFVAGATTLNFGADISVISANVDSTTKISANIAIGPNATTGPRTIYVSNPTPGGGNSGTISFSIGIAPPPAPILLSPVNGATFLPTNPMLRWNASAGATAYYIQVSTSTLFVSNVVDDSSLTGTARQATALQNGQTYYWRVRARNSGGASIWSDIWSFRPDYPGTIVVSHNFVYPTYSATTDYHDYDWRIVGLPGGNTSLIGSYFSGTQGSDWQVYTDNGASVGFLKPYDGGSDFTFADGKAFWLIKKGNFSVNIQVDAALLDTSGSVRIQLHRGWNLITDPFDKSVPWDAVKLVNGAGAQNAIWTYNGVNGWTASTSFDPYTGYYFFYDTVNAYLRIPYGATTGAMKRADSLQAGEWTIAVAAHNGIYTDASLQFGTRVGAEDGLDRFDYRKPRFLSEALSVGFQKTDQNGQPCVFATDFRPVVQKLSRWAFDVKAAAKTEVRLDFNGIGGIPEQLEAYLVDREGSRYVNLRSVPEYRFTPALPAAAFEVVVGSHDAMAAALSDVLPKAYALDNNFPNPFNPTTTIPVAVPHTSDVTLKIYNILGEEVRTLFSGSLESGRYWMTWDGRNDAGRGVASGVYFVRLTAPQGVSKVQKMMMMK
jgi:hypothetical protein